MDLFISWSGDKGKAVALAFRDWLPYVLPSLRPWLSEVDIDKGVNWESQMTSQLAKSSFGLACLTPESLNSPAIHFEAGALSKLAEDSRLWIFLFEVKYVDVSWPLRQFQYTQEEKGDIRKLLLSMNAALGENRLTDKVFEGVFEKWWPDLESSLNNIPKTPVAASARGATQGKLRLSELESQSKIQIPIQSILVGDKENSWANNALRDLKCPICNSEYQQVGAPNIIDGEDSYRGDWGGRGDLMVIPVIGECRHEWEICFGFHKGSTAIFARYYKDGTRPHRKRLAPSF